jgi:hypothetical protein
LKSAAYLWRTGDGGWAVDPHPAVCSLHPGRLYRFLNPPRRERMRLRFSFFLPFIFFVSFWFSLVLHKVHNVNAFKGVCVYLHASCRTLLDGFCIKDRHWYANLLPVKVYCTWSSNLKISRRQENCWMP